MPLVREILDPPLETIFILSPFRLEDHNSSPLRMGYPGGGFLVLEPSDVNKYKVCCEEKHMCEEFYKVRPSDTCEGYKAPHMGMSNRISVSWEKKGREVAGLQQI